MPGGSEVAKGGELVAHSSGQGVEGLLPHAPGREVLLVELHDLDHLVQQALVPDVAPGGDGFADAHKTRQCSLHTMRFQSAGEVLAKHPSEYYGSSHCYKPRRYI